ncbi:hypothetical protein INT46_001760 [Mucor plumbeus]|uniref:Uncharacterized protein n=1 Tax=Mucor plumbeus TaxID=97098 RepID=A0A8H7R884_9FUNG|nr:hypothetical protein INT46_001760 [Mucor plumbeus]
MKMDLQLIAIPVSKSISDNGYGEFAKLAFEPKFYKNKRKVVVASKALLNNIIIKNQTTNYEDMYIP